MSNIHVPHLQTGSITLESDEMARFPADKHRTFFAAQDDDQWNGFLWIGENPPANVLEWFSFGSTADVDTITIERGVYGPIYIAEPNNQGGQVTYLSPLDEQITIEPLPTE